MGRPVAFNLPRLFDDVARFMMKEPSTAVVLCCLVSVSCSLYFAAMPTHRLRSGKRKGEGYGEPKAKRRGGASETNPDKHGS